VIKYAQSTDIDQLLGAFLRYIIHGGADRIGGMCIEVAAEDGTQILLDLGMPLYDESGADYPRDTPQRPTRELIAEGILPNVPGLYADEPVAPSIAAIVVTHAHMDHYGLAHHAHPAIPVYGSVGTIALMRVADVFFPDTARPECLHELPTEEPLFIGGLMVTAIPVDHAAPDSRALLVEADGHRLLYTGDLRAHGREGLLLDALLNDPRVHGVDTLLIEGTTLGAEPSSHGARREADVENDLAQIAVDNPDSLVAVVCSGQNLDRLLSCYAAARASGRELVLDPYQAYILRALAPLSRTIPQFEWEHIRVYFAPHQVSRLKEAGLMPLVYEMKDAGKVSTDELAEHPGRYLMSTRSGFGLTKVFDKVGPEHVELVWSQWSGYWNRDGCAMREWAEGRGVRAEFVHAGGHAAPEDLARLVDGVGSKQTVFVHTESRHIAG